MRRTLLLPHAPRFPTAARRVPPHRRPGTTTRSIRGQERAYQPAPVDNPALGRELAVVPQGRRELATYSGRRRDREHDRGRAADLATTSGGGRSGRGSLAGGASGGNSGRSPTNFDPGMDGGGGQGSRSNDGGGGRTMSSPWAIGGGAAGGGGDHLAGNDGEGFRPARTVGRTPRRLRALRGVDGTGGDDGAGQPSTRRGAGGGAQRLHERL